MLLLVRYIAICQHQCEKQQLTMTGGGIEKGYAHWKGVHENTQKHNKKRFLNAVR